MKKGMIACGLWIIFSSFSWAAVVTAPRQSIDSRAIGTTNVGTTSVKQYPNVAIPTTRITNEQYDSLPVCPTTPDCPDINGNMANGRPPASSPPATCPTSCRVTRTVDFFDPADENSIITGTTPAVCPAGYVGVGVYKVGKEIVRTTQREAAPYPIPDMATYNGYVKAGYDCTEWVQAGKALNQCYFNDYPKFGGEVVKIIDGYVGHYYNYEGWLDGQFSKLWGPTAPVNRYTIGSNCGTRQYDPNGYYYILYNVYWAYEKCYREAGMLYYTANMVPTAIVCTVAKPTWNIAH